MDRSIGYGHKAVEIETHSFTRLLKLHGGQDYGRTDGQTQGQCSILSLARSCQIFARQLDSMPVMHPTVIVNIDFGIC